MLVKGDTDATNQLALYWSCSNDDVIKWKHFPIYWPFGRGIHRSPVKSPLKGLWRGALMFSLICVWINGWVNNREASDWRRYCTHYDVTVMLWIMECSKLIPAISSTTNISICILPLESFMESIWLCNLYLHCIYMHSLTLSSIKSMHASSIFVVTYTFRIFQFKVY